MPIRPWTKAAGTNSHVQIENVQTDDYLTPHSAYADIFACSLSSKAAPQTNEDKNRKLDIDKLEEKAAAVPDSITLVEHNIHNGPCPNDTMKVHVAAFICCNRIKTHGQRCCLGKSCCPTIVEKLADCITDA